MDGDSTSVEIVGFDCKFGSVRTERLAKVVGCCRLEIDVICKAAVISVGAAVAAFVISLVVEEFESTS